MADIGTITQGASYKGDAALGGAIGTAIKIDTTPIERFAQFHYYSEKAKWDKINLDNQLAAKEIGEMTAMDPTSPLKGFSGPLTEKVQKLREFYTSNMSSLYFDKDPKKWQQRKEMEADFTRARNAANTNGVLYTARQAWIDTLPQEQKVIEQKRLDLDVEDLFSEGFDGAINKRLSSAPEIKQEAYEIPKTAIQTFDITHTDPNTMVTSTYKVIDLAKLKADATLLHAGIGRKGLDEKTEAFGKLSKERKQFLREEAAFIAAPRADMDKMAATLNDLIAQKKLKDPKFIPSAVTGDLETGDTILGIVKSANIYNSQIDELSKMTGKKYEKINVDDGISADELIMLNAIQKNGNSIFQGPDEKITQTDNALQQYNAATARENVRADNANSKAALAENIRQFNLTHPGATTGKIIDQFGNIIYGINAPIVKAEGGGRIVNGAIVNDKGDIVDYSGVRTVPASGIDNSIFTEFNKYQGDVKMPSRIKRNEDGTYNVKFENGVVNSIETTEGWATIDQFANITQKSALTGVTKYKPPTHIGYTTPPKAKAQEPLSTKAADWKKEGQYWKYKDGTLYDDNGNTINKK